jgi:uncharacterized membrane protein
MSYTCVLKDELDELLGQARKSVYAVRYGDSAHHRRRLAAAYLSIIGMVGQSAE